MSQNSKTVDILKDHLSKLSGIISKEFKKPKHRVTKEILYGIETSKGFKAL
jgi:hypothetical protein|tara:strand:- start:309 stop:461 length:153 start_codon:yes stop_codon:yes gene_type:complete